MGKRLIAKLKKYELASLLKEKVVNPQTKFSQQASNINAIIDSIDFNPTQLAKEVHKSESHVYRKLK